MWLFVPAALADDVRPEFSAGSYGRVQASTDLAGGGGDAVNVAAHPPRLEKGPYLELDLGWHAALDDASTVDVVITPAVTGDVFHYDGQFGNDLGIRNLYAEIARGGKLPVAVWAGSRMYRGDDVYLLDYWPLDQLNTYGGGVILTPGATEVALHVGVNRLRGDDWQVQEVTVATPGSVTGESVLVLDRQRTIGTLRASHKFDLGEGLTFRAKIYGELHALPAGERIIVDPFQDLATEPLPADRGSTIGLQLSAWGWAKQSFVHLWVRRSTGLAATGELTIPMSGLDLDLRVASARTWHVAIGGNQETEHLGVMAAAYVEYRTDADGLVEDFDDRWEAVAVVRPTLYLDRHAAIAIEASHQWVRPNGLNPRTNDWDRPNVTKLSLLPGWQVGKGSYARPRVQLQYTATFLDADARDFYNAYDARLQDGVQHFVGLGAEWWINSKRVITPS